MSKPFVSLPLINIHFGFLSLLLVLLSLRTRMGRDRGAGSELRYSCHLARTTRTWAERLTRISDHLYVFWLWLALRFNILLFDKTHSTDAPWWVWWYERSNCQKQDKKEKRQLVLGARIVSVRYNDDGFIKLIGNNRLFYLLNRTHTSSQSKSVSGKICSAKPCLVRLPASIL